MYGKKAYFLSDIHLGSAYHIKNLPQEKIETLKKEGVDIRLYAQQEVERRLCRFLDSIKEDAKTIYLVGDIFDYWFEYRYVVPRGYTRFLGKLSELTDMGIEIHFFIGNHDIWLTDYLQNECGLIIHRESFTFEIFGKKFHITHGDGLGDNSKSFKLIRAIFHSRICRLLYATIHPRWTTGFAYWWSNHSRENGEMPPYMGENKEHLVLYTKDYSKDHPDINFYIYGHRHIMLDLMISRSTRIAILGDWIRDFSYGIYDGETFSLNTFEE